MQALILSMQQPTPGEVFNIVDNDCGSRANALEFAAKLRGVTEQLQAVLSAQSRHGDALDGVASKHVSNRKAVEMLGWELQYPSYREGLTAISAEKRGAT